MAPTLESVLVITERLTLVPVGPEHLKDLVVLHSGLDVTYWYAGAWTRADAHSWAGQMHQSWEREGAGKWMAYRHDDGETSSFPAGVEAGCRTRPALRDRLSDAARAGSDGRVLNDPLRGPLEAGRAGARITRLE